MSNPTKLIEKYIRIRDELYEVQRKVSHLQSELDGTTNELVEFFENNNLIKSVELKP